MDDGYKSYESDVLSEFDKLRTRLKSEVAEKNEDLSKTIVIPRVEDLIEERPLTPAVNAAELFDATSIINDTNYPKQTVSGEETAMKGSKKNKKHKKKSKRKFGFKKLILTLLAICLICVIGVGVYVGITVKNAPKINPDNIYTLLSENSIIYDRNGEVIDNIYSGDSLRTNLEYNQLPKQLVNAFVSIEDKTFWDHHGFNIIRIFGAVWQKVLGQSDRIGGTSTITQQLARNLYLADVKSKRSMTRKVTEAYYTIQLERKLSKEQIIEAYLNTIYLGYNCNGVAAAAEAYFDKEVQDLTLIECAQLASLPQSPNNYAPLKRVAADDVADIESLDIIAKDDNWIVYYNGAGANRINLVLRFMYEQGKIDNASYEAAKSDSIRNYLNPGSSAVNNNTSSYFADYVKSQVVSDLVASGYDEETATKLLYNGGLRIYSTMDMRAQAILDKEYENTANFPGVSIQWKDSQGNALDSNKRVLLYNMATYFNADGDFVLAADEYEELSNGDLMFYSGKRLNFYKTSVSGKIDYSAEFKNLYEITEGKVCYSRAGGVWNIPAEYKDRDSDNNLIVSSKFMAEKPDAFTKNEDGTLTLSHNYFTLKQRVRQPQSAMVIMDYTNGHIIAMVGGRGIEGKLLYNRATSTRQPGSSIKPLAVYSTALQLGAEGIPGYTAAMPIDDAPILRAGSLWPKNWYSGYRGMTNLRHAVEQSINACAVNLFMKMADPDRCIEQLQKMGITSIVTEQDNYQVNDANASALALGGMTKGISPLEMTAAYGTFGNFGTYTEPICYTSVTTKSGDIVLEKTASHMEVMDESVASLMTNILQSVVTNGLGSGAKLNSQPSAGKTGTTSEKYDIWFCGLTPQYSAACWIGSDVNVPVSTDSSMAAKLWAKVMDQVCANLPRGEFEMRGDFVTATVDKYTGTYSAYMTGDSSLTEIFIKGTEPGAMDDMNSLSAHTTARVCAVTGYLSTPLCPEVTKLGVVRPSGLSWEKQLALYAASAGDSLNMTANSMPDAWNDIPDYYCPIHNPDPVLYPISPYADEHENNVPADSIIDENPMDEDYNDEDGPEIVYIDTNDHSEVNENIQHAWNAILGN